MIVPENTGVYINDFMFDLGLKGFELLAYALVYSYSSNGNKQGYWGSCENMAKRLHTTRQRVNIVLNSLADKGLIIKHEIFDNNVKFCVYQTNYDVEINEGGVAETMTGCCRNDDRGVVETMHNNIYNNIINNINSNSSSVANAPSSELANEEKINEAKMWDSLPDNPPSPTKSKKSSETHNTVCEDKSKVSVKDVVTHYTERWNIMKEHGYVHTDCPPQSYPQIGKLVKNSGASLDQIKSVIDAGFKSSEDIIKSNGYALKTMLSSWWVNKVLNGTTSEPKRNYKKQPASPYKLDKNADYSEENW